MLATAPSNTPLDIDDMIVVQCPQPTRDQLRRLLDDPLVRPGLEAAYLACKKKYNKVPLTLTCIDNEGPYVPTWGWPRIKINPGLWAPMQPYTDQDAIDQLRHELTHIRQRCHWRHDDFYGDLDTKICNEIQAYCNQHFNNMCNKTGGLCIAVCGSIHGELNPNWSERRQKRWQDKYDKCLARCKTMKDNNLCDNGWPVARTR